MNGVLFFMACYFFFAGFHQSRGVALETCELGAFDCALAKALAVVVLRHPKNLGKIRVDGSGARSSIVA